MIVTQEGCNARARSGRLNYLFRDSNRSEVIATYEKFFARALDHFGRRWRSVTGLSLDAQGLEDLAQEATLSCMYFYIVNGMPVEITEADWDHPQTWRIVQRIVERRFPAGSEEATSLCAQLTGQSREDYVGWRRGDELFQNR